MLTHLLVLVDKSAPAFCHYAHDCRQTDLMPLATLKKTLAFARKRRLALTLLLGREPLPPAYRALLAKTAHGEIVPAAVAARHPDAIIVLDGADSGRLADTGAKRRLIVRLPRERLTGLAALIGRCLGKVTRLDLRLGDIDRYTVADIAAYQRQLGRAAALVTAAYRQGSLPEVNIFSDRMLLSAMNNCDAGVVHLTVAPDGRFYLCPGFYYDGQPAVGSLAAGIAIANEQLLTLANAPVCARCDAYHCKRCLYLNAKTTLEINTPSRQQCVLAHLERNTARLIQQRLGAMPPFARQVAIPAVDYLDPFDQIIAGGLSHE